MLSKSSASSKSGISFAMYSSLRMYFPRASRPLAVNEACRIVSSTSSRLPSVGAGNWTSDVIAVSVASSDSISSGGISSE